MSLTVKQLIGDIITPGEVIEVVFDDSPDQEWTDFELIRKHGELIKYIGDYTVTTISTGSEQCVLRIGVSSPKLTT